MVAIQGEAGLRKSTLLTTTEELAGDGWSTVKAAGSAIEADLPFAYVQQLGGQARKQATGRCVAMLAARLAFVLAQVQRVGTVS